MDRRTCFGAAALSLVVFVGGCSDGGSGQKLSASQVEAIWSSTYQAVNQTTNELLPEIQANDRPNPDGGLLDRDGGLLDRDGGMLDRDGGGWTDRDGGSGWITGTIAEFTISGTIENPNGAGTATITGTGGKSGTNWGVEAAITFLEWTTRAGIPMEGSLTLGYALSSVNPLEMEIGASGALRVKPGKIPMLISVDARVTVSGTTTTVCGEVAAQPVGVGPGP
jgi:hypothetical protein